VDGARSAGASPRPADHAQWHIPAFDLSHQHKYLYKIHSLDLYLWTINDAAKLLDLIKRILPQPHLHITEADTIPEHQGSMSPVVQQLENMAIHTPPHARAASTISDMSTQSRRGHTPETPRTIPLQTLVSTPVPGSFAPYNPAAPSAPEPIAHREKTPPPIDAGSGTGLAAAATHEQPGHYTTAGAQYNPHQNVLPGPPQRSTSLGAFLPPPPQSMGSPHPGIQAAHSFAGPPGSYHAQQQPQTQFATYPQHQSAHYPQSPGFSMHTHTQSPGIPSTPSQLAAYSNHTPLQSPGFAAQATPVQSPGLPPSSHGGFSNYTYAPQALQTVPAEAFGIHSQAYRPTELEAAAHGHGHEHSQQGAVRRRGFEERLKKTEKGVGRFLRKLDQKM
jgi:hypothetical protein